MNFKKDKLRFRLTLYTHHTSRGPIFCPSILISTKQVKIPKINDVNVMNLVTEKVFVSRSEKHVLSGARCLRFFRRLRFLIRIDTPQHSIEFYLTPFSDNIPGKKAKFFQSEALSSRQNNWDSDLYKIQTIPETAPNAEPSSPLSLPNQINSPQFPSSVT